MLLRVFDTLIGAIYSSEVLSTDRITYPRISSIKVWKTCHTPATANASISHRQQTGEPRLRANSYC